MKRLVITLLALFVSVGVRAQTPTPATFKPLPANNASFFTTLYTFLVGEAADRDDAGFNPFRISNCIHGTAAGMVGTFGATCNAMVAGSLTIEPAASIDYAALGASVNDVCWTALDVSTTTSHSGWTRDVGTHYIVKCTGSSAARPTLATDTMILMGVTITTGAIIAVTTEPNEWPSVRTYTNSSEIVSTRSGQWWQSTINSRMCYTNGSTCVTVPLADASGCATCGDSASSFFSTGLIEAVRGGTGITTAAATGIPRIGPTPGVWTTESAIRTSEGGFGASIAACESSGGVPYFTTSSALACAFPAVIREFAAYDFAVDAAQCVRADHATLLTGVLENAVTCADNNAGRIFAITHLPANYSDGASISLRLVAANGGVAAGVTGFDATCMCAADASGGSTLNAGNFASAENIDFTWSGTTGQIQSVTATITCGGSCLGNQSLIVKLSVDASATTHASPTDIKYTNMVLQAAGDSL